MVNSEISAYSKEPDKITQYDQFVELSTTSKMKDDMSNAVELMAQITNGNIDDMQKIQKAWGGLTQKQFNDQLREYRKETFGLTDEELNTEEESTDVVDIMKRYMNGENVSMSELDKVDKYESQNPIAAARLKMKILNPDMTDAQVYIAVKNEFNPPATKKTKSSGTKNAAETQYYQDLIDTYGITLDDVS